MNTIKTYEDFVNEVRELSPENAIVKYNNGEYIVAVDSSKNKYAIVYDDGLGSEWPIVYTDKLKIAYDYPYRIPEYLKKALQIIVYDDFNVLDDEDLKMAFDENKELKKMFKNYKFKSI